MRHRDEGRSRRCGRMSLVGGVLVIVTGCAAELSDPVPEARAPQAATETDASDAWQGVRLEGMTVDRSNPVRRGGAAAPLAGPDGVNIDRSVVSVPGAETPGLDPSEMPRGGAADGGAGDVPLTFIGFVESPGIEGRVVVLTDGDLLFHGRVGDVIDGRYRIVGVGLESVDVERVDGRGRQTLRLPPGE